MDLETFQEQLRGWLEEQGNPRYIALANRILAFPNRELEDGLSSVPSPAPPDHELDPVGAALEELDTIVFEKLADDPGSQGLRDAFEDIFNDRVRSI
jgi:hypothetical protein